MKTIQELNNIIDEAKTVDIYPSKTQQYMAQFMEALRYKLITYYGSEEKNNWKSFEREILLNIAETEYGFIKKTAGIEIFLIDKNIFIPLKEWSPFDMIKKDYTSYAHSPKYALLKEGLLIHIPIRGKKKIKDAYHYFELDDIKNI
jgi:hypothetical protein